MNGLGDLRLCFYCSGRVPRAFAAGPGRGAPRVAAGSKPCVLVVDDDPNALATLCRALKSRCQLVAARSAEEALEKLKHVLVDAVVSDYHMPGDDGRWLLREVQTRCPWARRVLISGDEVADAVALVAAGAVHAFVSKPCFLDELLAALGIEERR